jgi:four helix bundle protein
MGHFKKLKAWQHARALALVSKPLIARLPSDEKSGLASQWRRAANSVVLNIAEGASRPGPKEFRRHLGIARASLDEIEAIIDLAARVFAATRCITSGSGARRMRPNGLRSDAEDRRGAVA